MLSKKSLERIAALTKLDVAVIKAAIEDQAEKDLTIDDKLTVLTNDELTQRDNNNKATGKAEGQTIGEGIGKDLAVKTIKSKLGITDASKDPEVVAGLLQTKLSSDTAIQDQVKLLQKDKETLTSKIEELTGKLSLASTDSELMSLLPNNRSKALETAEHLQLIKNNLEFTTEGVKYKGNILREANTQSPLGKKEAIEYFYTQRNGLLETPTSANGRGAGDSNSGTGGKFKTLKEVRKAWQAQNPGKNWGGVQAEDETKKAIAANPDLVMEDDGT